MAGESGLIAIFLLNFTGDCDMIAVYARRHF